MIHLIYRTDVHLAVQAPQSRTDDWATTVLGKLVQVGEVAREVGASGVLDNGDFFHIKTPSRTTHELVRLVAEVHQGYPCPVYANIGNHDCKYGDLSFLSESPLGVLFDTGVFKRCYGHQEAFFQQEGVKVRVVGVPYHGRQYDPSRWASITRGDEDFLVVMAHLLASPQGGEMFGGEDIVRYDDLAGLSPDAWCFGHWHKNQGIVRLGDKYIINTGSLTRGALTEDEVTRVPECVVLTFSKTGMTAESHPLKVAPAGEVFDIVGRTRQEARAMTVNAFVESIQKSLVASPAQSLLDTVRAFPAPDQVRERLIAYLEAEGAI